MMNRRTLLTRLLTGAAGMAAVAALPVADEAQASDDACMRCMGLTTSDRWSEDALSEARAEGYRAGWETATLGAEARIRARFDAAPLTFALMADDCRRLGCRLDIDDWDNWTVHRMTVDGTHYAAYFENRERYSGRVLPFSERLQQIDAWRREIHGRED